MSKNYLSRQITTWNPSLQQQEPQISSTGLPPIPQPASSSSSPSRNTGNIANDLNSPEPNIRNLRQHTIRGERMKKAAEDNDLLGFYSAKDRLTINEDQSRARKQNYVAEYIVKYIKHNRPGFDIEKYKQIKEAQNIKIKDIFVSLSTDEDVVEKINNIDHAIDTNNNLPKYLDENLLYNPWIVEDLNKLLFLIHYYERKEETKQAIKMLGTSHHMGTPARAKQKREIKDDEWKSMGFNIGIEGEDEEEPLNPTDVKIDYGYVEAEQERKDHILKEQLIEIIKSELLNEGKNDELNFENVNHFKVIDADDEIKKIIIDAMRDSDEQVTITSNISNPDELKTKPSELEQLASELGAKYMWDNLQRGVEVEPTDRDEESSTEKNDRVIIGTKMDIKGSDDIAKKEETKIVCTFDKVTGTGISHPRRSNRALSKPKYLQEEEEEKEEKKRKHEKELNKKRDIKKISKKNQVLKTGENIDTSREGLSVLSTSTFSQAASQIIFDLVKSDKTLKISIDKLIKGNYKDLNSSQIYTKLLYYTCKLRPSTAHFQEPKPAEARDAASTGISEKTQFADIWGPWVFNYASAQSNLNGEFDKSNTNAQPVKCYICKKYLVPFSEKIGWGSKGKTRSCSEMEHTLPCITAFTQAPTYVLLDRYKHNGTGYLKLWKRFTEREDDDSIYDNMKELYKLINEEDSFDEIKIKNLLETLMTKFKNYCFVEDNDPTFKWVIEVIKYWLFEFSYAHHICNQVKSNRDIENEMESYLTDTQNRWRGSVINTKQLGQDTIDKAEAKYVSESERKSRKNIYLNKTLITKNLNERFAMMRSFSGKNGEGGTIRSTYMDITSIPEHQITGKDRDDIMTVMVTKGMIMMYKYYKQEKYKEEQKALSKNKKESKKQKTERMNRENKKSAEILKKMIGYNALPLPPTKRGRIESQPPPPPTKRGRKEPTRKPQTRRRGGTIKRKQNKRKQRTIKRKQKKNRKQRTIKRKQNKRKQRTIKKQKK